MVETVLVRLHRQGRLIVSRSGQVTLTDRSAYAPIETALIAAAGPKGRSTVGELRRAVGSSPAVRRIGEQLAEQGLMYRPELQRRAVLAHRLLSVTLVLVAALGVSLVVRYGSELADGRTSPPLFLAFLVLLPVGLVWRHRVTPDRRRITPEGINRLRCLRPVWWPRVLGDGSLKVAKAMALELSAIALGSPRAAEDSGLRTALADGHGSTSSGESACGASGTLHATCGSSSCGTSSSEGNSSSSCGSSCSSSSCGGSSCS